MPTIDIDIDDFLWNCSKQDIRNLIEALAENEHLPKGFLNHKGKLNQEYTGKGRLEEDFSDKLDKLKDKYYSLTLEEEEFFDKVFKKYL